MAKITVLGRRNSNNVIPVMWTIDELGLEYERKNYGGTFGGTSDPEYRAINPNGTIPAIVDNGFPLYESNAIVRYLCMNYDNEVLMPKTKQEFAIADQWMEWYKATLYHVFHPWFWSIARTKQAEQDPAKTRELKNKLDRLLLILDHHLSRNEYITGNSFSMGDIPLGVAINRYFTLNEEEQNLAALRRWRDLLATRAAFKKHVDFPFGRSFEEFARLERDGAAG